VVPAEHGFVQTIMFPGKFLSRSGSYLHEGLCFTFVQSVANLQPRQLMLLMMMRADIILAFILLPLSQRPTQTTIVKTDIRTQMPIEDIEM